MILKTVIIALTIFTIQGCGVKNACPKYPEASQEVLDKIKSLDDDNVDDWIVEQHVLSLKLKLCK